MNTSTTNVRVRSVAPISANTPAIDMLCQYTALQGEGARALIWFLTTVRESIFFQNKKFTKIPLSFVLGCSYVETFWSFRDLPLNFVSLELILPQYFYLMPRYCTVFPLWPVGTCTVLGPGWVLEVDLPALLMFLVLVSGCFSYIWADHPQLKTQVLLCTPLGCSLGSTLVSGSLLCKR